MDHKMLAAARLSLKLVLSRTKPNQALSTLTSVVKPMMYNEALRWLERIFNSFMLSYSLALSNEAWGGIYCPTHQTSHWEKAYEIP